MKLTVLLGTTAILSAGLLPISAYAQDSDIQTQIEELKKQLALLEQKTEELAKKAEASRQVAIIKKAEPAPLIGTPDGLHEMNMRGRLLVDFGWANGDNGAVDVSASELRAAWLGIEGKAYNVVKYKFEADFGSNKVSLKDAYFQWGKDWTVTVGHFKQTNSLEFQTSGAQTNTMERSSMVNGFGIGRGLGVSVRKGGENWSLTGGAFKGGAGTKLNDEGLTLTARATYGVKMDDMTLMGAASLRDRDLGDGTISYKARPGHHLSPTSAGVNASGTNKDRFAGLEFAAQSGPFHFASEWGWLTAEKAAMGADANFKAGYFEAGYFLTGEAKPLDVAKGSWGRPKVDSPFLEGGMGAWQLVGKLDTIDLNDNGIYGGKMNSYILGVNWYLNRFTRFVANYSTSSVSSPFVDRDVDAFGLRFQVEW